MSNERPYDGYEPNEPEPAPVADHGKKPLSPASPLTQGAPYRMGETAARGNAAQPPARRAATQPPVAQPAVSRVWDLESYLPNEAERFSQYPQQVAAPERYEENPYTRATWDETPYIPEAALPSAPEAQGNPYAVPAQDAQAAMRGIAPEADPARVFDERSVLNRYTRPVTDIRDSVGDLSARFAPPLKFELPLMPQTEATEAASTGKQAEPNVYQTRRPDALNGHETGAAAFPRAGDYRLEDTTYPVERGRRKGRVLKRALAALGILAVLAGGAYLGRDWLLAQLRSILGSEAAQTVNEAIGGAKRTVTGYDPAPTAQVGDKAKRGITAVAGEIGLEPYAVTGGNIIERVPDANGTYEVYLFAASDGQLLGYYENVPENGFLVCPDDIYYVNQPPYLINAEGLPLIDPSRYRQAAGEDAVLGPMINGWAVIRTADATAYNFINADGALLSTLWFAKLYPFTANATLAYVDTGNVTNSEERYALYQIARTGEMKLWRHAPNMEDVVGCAAGVALLNTGELVRLNDEHTVLCITDDVAVYADCGAAVARDTQTGKYGLIVNGEQQYDFAYDSIAPMPSDITWTASANGAYRLLTVTGMAYPLPLSHYFALQKDGAQEMVALSTLSVYPLLLP